LLEGALKLGRKIKLGVKKIEDVAGALMKGKEQTMLIWMTHSHFPSFFLLSIFKPTLDRNIRVSQLSNLFGYILLQIFKVLITPCSSQSVVFSCKLSESKITINVGSVLV